MEAPNATQILNTFIDLSQSLPQEAIVVYLVMNRELCGWNDIRELSFNDLNDLVSMDVTLLENMLEMLIKEEWIVQRKNGNYDLPFLEEEDDED